MAKTTKEAVAFDSELLSADAGSALAALGKAGERAADLVEAWVNAKNAAAVVAAAESDGAPGPARKAARRGINVLKARGVAIPDRTHVARMPTDAIEGYEAWFVPPDGGGSAIVLIASRRQSGKYRIVHAILRDGVGLLEIRVLEMSRAQLKTSFDESTRRVGYPPASVPLDWARARVAAAKSENAKSGAILPLGLDTDADILGPAPASAPVHPVDAAKIDVKAASGSVAESAVLHNEPELRGWLPTGQAMQELLLDVGQKLGAGASGDTDDAAKSPTEGPQQEKVDSAIGAAIDAATDRFFAPEIRERLAARMKDSAISILARAGRERAAQVLATADATVAAGLITSPPHEVPFLRAFFQKGLAMVAAQSGGRLEIPVPTQSESPSP
jgi:hypothetical protein